MSRSLDTVSSQSESHPGQRTTTKQKVQLAPIFRWCVEDPLNIIQDYALGEPTLEQVFLKFARRQELLDAMRELMLAKKEQVKGKGCCGGSEKTEITIPSLLDSSKNTSKISENDKADAIEEAGTETPIDVTTDKETENLCLDGTTEGRIGRHQ